MHLHRRMFCEVDQHSKDTLARTNRIFSTPQTERPPLGPAGSHGHTEARILVRRKLRGGSRPTQPPSWPPAVPSVATTGGASVCSVEARGVQGEGGRARGIPLPGCRPKSLWLCPLARQPTLRWQSRPRGNHRSAGSRPPAMPTNQSCHHQRGVSAVGLIKCR